MDIYISNYVFKENHFGARKEETGERNKEGKDDEKRKEKVVELSQLQPARAVQELNPGLQGFRSVACPKFGQFALSTEI